jgi:hypothetical protein
MGVCIAMGNGRVWPVCGEFRRPISGDVDGGPSRDSEVTVGLPNGHRFRLASACILQGHVTLTDLEMTSGMIRCPGATVAKLWELAEKKCATRI